MARVQTARILFAAITVILHHATVLCAANGKVIPELDHVQMPIKYKFWDPSLMIYVGCICDPMNLDLLFGDCILFIFT